MVTYNHENYIKEAVESVLMQVTNFPFELIVANDFSTDNTDSIINSLLNYHPKGNIIRYFNQNKNIGIVSNFTFALSKCKGDYIALCDGDDYWTDKSKLQKQFDYLEMNKNYVMSFHSAQLLESGVFKSFILKNSISLSSEDIFSCKTIPTSTVFFRNLVQDFQKYLPEIYNLDTFLFCYLANLTGRGAFFDSTIEPSIYRIHDGGIWSLRSVFLKYSISFETMKILYKVFIDYRPVIKIRMHEMIMYSSQELSSVEYFKFSFRYLSFLTSNREFGQILHFIKCKFSTKNFI
jgi:glycosyltransferase involved in cell wall biosynthesis